MLSKNDIMMFRGMVREEVKEVVTEVVTKVIEAKVPKMIAVAIEANNYVLKREIRDEMQTLIKASEAGIIRRMDVMEERLLDAIGSMVDVQISPQIERCEDDIVIIKRQLKLA